MRVLFVSLVMVLVAGVMGAPTDAPSEPNKCCFGMQYTTTLGLIGGQVYPITGNTVFLDVSIPWLAYLITLICSSLQNTPARVNQRRIKSEEIG